MIYSFRITCGFSFRMESRQGRIGALAWGIGWTVLFALLSIELDLKNERT